MQKGVRPKYDALANNFSKDVIFNFYIIENHSFDDCVKEFNTTSSVLKRYLKDNNIVKPKKLVKKLIDKTKFDRYGDMNYNNREKSKETCLNKYGSSSPLACRDIWEKTYKSTIDKHGGTGFQLFSREKRSLVAIKAAKQVWNNCLLIDGYRDKMKNSEYATKKSNNTFNTSIKEEEYYKYLISIYGDSDIERNYKDERYPFRCDFYVKSKDKFIELNLHWTHGGHPFNETNEDDIKKLNKWKEKAKTSKFYENAIYTWTVRDVEKLNKLINNNLNYDLIYKL